MYSAKEMWDITTCNSDFYINMIIEQIDVKIKGRAALGFSWLETNLYTVSKPYKPFPNLTKYAEKITAFYQNLGYNVTAKPKWISVPTEEEIAAQEYDCIHLRISWEPM